MVKKEKVAIVTGGSTGIGKEIALELARRGSTVVIAYIGDEQEAVNVRQQIEELGGHSEIKYCDVTNYVECQALMAFVMEKYDHLDILINNAGISHEKSLIKMSPEEFTSVIDVNLTGTFHMTRLAARQMFRQKSGRIINIASTLAFSPILGHANYTASKAGVVGLTKAAALELASRGVTVNAVAPGYIDTGMTDNTPRRLREIALEHIPMKKSGQAKDVANAVAFLASDEASYITGQILAIDGGASLL